MRYATLLRPRLSSSFITRSLGYGTARAFTVLALESSADDTCAAVVTSDRKILSNVVINQQIGQQISVRTGLRTTDDL